MRHRILSRRRHLSAQAAKRKTRPFGLVDAMQKAQWEITEQNQAIRQPSPAVRVTGSQCGVGDVAVLRHSEVGSEIASAVADPPG